MDINERSLWQYEVGTLPSADDVPCLQDVHLIGQAFDKQWLMTGGNDGSPRILPLPCDGNDGFLSRCVKSRQRFVQQQ
ncbi:hypothetical protein D1872_288970 [compost metagenome]